MKKIKVRKKCHVTGNKHFFLALHMHRCRSIHIKYEQLCILTLAEENTLVNVPCSVYQIKEVLCCVVEVISLTIWGKRRRHNDVCTCLEQITVAATDGRYLLSGE